MGRQVRPSHSPILAGQYLGHPACGLPAKPHLGQCASDRAHHAAQEPIATDLDLHDTPLARNLQPSEMPHSTPGAGFAPRRRFVVTTGERCWAKFIWRNLGRVFVNFRFIRT